MATNCLTSRCIELDVSCGGWKEAVRAGAALLLQQDCITAQYTESIIRHHEKFGPYMVVAPGIMLAHARPEDGAKTIGLSLIRLQEAIPFGNSTNDPVKLVFTLSTTDVQGHVALLSRLMNLLTNEAAMQVLLTTEHTAEIVALFSEQSGG